jgi:hypothetical protein
MQVNNLTSNVNVAIDEGLWYEHKTMQRYTVGTTNEGDWDNLAPTFFAAGDMDCDNVSNSQAINASNVQAFEVNGHLESGPASNPYTEDLKRALARIFSQLGASAIPNTKSLNYAAPPTCPALPCSFNPDTNGNGLAVFPDSGNPNTNRSFYQGGQFIDAIVGTGTPAAVTATGPANIIGRTYKDIAQDMLDGYFYCQDSFSDGGWDYNCQGGGDDSVSQWAAIGLIAAARSFGLSIPPIVLDANKVWLHQAQAANGEFGYRSSSPLWGPYAVTPSGMVQLALDEIGRGDARWDHAETFMRDNFDNDVSACGANPSCAAGLNVKSYVYGLFSFTKSMLLHDPGGALTPITLLQSKTAGVNPIDWYAAEVSKGDTSDGVARTLVNRQNAAGFWSGHSYVSNHFPFETGWSIIMLRRTVFIACVEDLQGRGTRSGLKPARIDLTWTGISNVDHYNVLRGTAHGGPYSLIGSSSVPAYSDKVGLTNGNTYFYVLQPINANAGEICQSNEAAVTVPH